MLIENIPTPEKGSEKENDAPLEVLQAQAVAIWYCRENLIPVETSAISLPIPIEIEQKQYYRFMVFSCGNDDEIGDYYYYEPEIQVTVDKESLEVSEHKILRKPDYNHEELLCYRYSYTVQQTDFEDVDRLYQELLELYQALIPLIGQSDLTPEKQGICKRYDQLFRFLVNSALFPYYENLNPDFFTWLDSQTGLTERKQITETPEVDPNIEAPPQTFPEMHEASAIERLTPEAGAPWVADTATLLRTLQDAGLNPSEVSPLYNLKPSEDNNGEEPTSLFDWVAEDNSDTWKSVLKTLCEPTMEIFQLFIDNIAVFNTHILISHNEVNADGEAYWVRYTQNDSGHHEIAYSIYPERMRDLAIQGLLATDIKEAKQIIHSFSMDEISVLFALADLKSLQSESLKTVTQETLLTIWEEKEDKERAYWTDLSRLISPVSLKKTPAEHIADGIKQLESQGLLQIDDQTVTIQRKLRVLLKEFEIPHACTNLTLQYKVEGDSCAVEGFSAIRTTNKLWVWEHRNDYELSKADGKIEVNFFQVSGQQLKEIYNDFLNIETEDAQEKSHA